MNLKTDIATELWKLVSGPYEAGNYTHAILEAVHQLTTVLREMSGADADGAALVGQALGGETPKLRVNSLQSESERNVQKGMEQLLRGIYLFIRNPRSHEQSTDTQEDADAIIHFLDFVLKILNASKPSFTIERFMQSVSDPEFVELKRYAEVIVSEVPPNRRGDALLALYSARRSTNLRKLRFLIPSLMSLLSEAQLAQYLATVSDELRTAREDVDIRTALQMLTPELWPRIVEPARLRIENKLLRSVKEGEVIVGKESTGSLGTWSSSFMKHFSLRAEGAGILLNKLEDTDADDRRYVAKYFLYRLPEILTEETEIKRAVRAIAAAIRNGDLNMREALVSTATYMPAAWQSQLSEALRDLTDPKNPAVILDGGIPFLAAPTADQRTEITEDDIPF